MLQNPRIAFRDPKLQRALIEKNSQNQPRPWAGAFAVVYKGFDPETQQPFAVRAFTTESPERRERYDFISAYLQGRKLRCLVDFEYRDRSLRSAGDGKWYPMIVMEWVQGETLFHWLRARCMEGNREMLTQVADRWLESIQELNDNSIAHGDLQHANVMVTQAGQLKFVDYDCMCVPQLVGRRNLEVGVEPYQHPDRGAATLLSLDLDNFSALLIYVALRALAVQPGLWIKYVEQVGYDKLLFRREDFQNPQQSPLYFDIASLGNADLWSVTEKLFALAQARMEEVPPLGSLTNSYAEVEHLLVAQQWQSAVALLNRRGHFRDAPARLRPLIERAYVNEGRQKAWVKFARIPADLNEAVDRQLIELWNESLFAEFPPAEQQRQRVNDARQRLQLIERLRHLIQRAAGKMSLSSEKALATTAGALPQGYQFSLRERINQARARVMAFARLEKALQSEKSEAAIVAAWRAVVDAKCEAFVSIEWGARIGIAEERLPIFKALSKIPPDAPLDQRDARVLAVWNEKLLKNCPEAEKWQPFYQMASVRREVLKRLQGAIDAQDDGAVVQWAAKRCLAKYPLPPTMTTAIQGARERLGRSESLLAALRSACEGKSSEEEKEESTVLPSDGEIASEGAASESEATKVPIAATVPSPILEQFDVRAVRGQAERFSTYKDQLIAWLQSELLPLDKLGLSIGDQPAVAPVEEPEGHYRATWKWPEERLADACLLAVCPAPPQPIEDGKQPDPAKGALGDESPPNPAVPATWRETITRAHWNAGEPFRTIPAEKSWEGQSVVVWAIVDLGFVKLYSPPLILGQIESRGRWKWPRLFSRRTETEPT
jgi:hypothetical protein